MRTLTHEQHEVLKKFIIDTYKKHDKKIISEKAFDFFLNTALLNEINQALEKDLLNKRWSISKNISFLIYPNKIELYFIDNNLNIDEQYSFYFPSKTKGAL